MSHQEVSLSKDFYSSLKQKANKFFNVDKRGHSNKTRHQFTSDQESNIMSSQFDNSTDILNRDTGSTFMPLLIKDQRNSNLIIKGPK